MAKDKVESFDKRREKFLEEVNVLGDKYKILLRPKIVSNPQDGSLYPQIFIIDKQQLEENSEIVKSKPRPKGGLIDPTKED